MKNTKSGGGLSEGVEERSGDFVRLGRFEVKRVENTKWDYIVPLGLVVIAFIYFSYYKWNCFDCVLNRMTTVDRMPPIYYTGLIGILFFAPFTVYLNRVQRIFLSLVFILGLDVAIGQIDRTTQNFWVYVDVKNLIFRLSLASLFGNFSLFSMFGDIGEKTISGRRRILAVGFLGIGLYGATGLTGCPQIAIETIFCPTIIPKHDFLIKILHYTEYERYPNVNYAAGNGYITNFILFSILGGILEFYQRKRKGGSE